MVPVIRFRSRPTQAEADAPIAERLRTQSSVDRSVPGRCQLSVTVEADGRLGYFSVASAKSGNARLADKLADYLRQGPVWTPGRRNGKAVRTLHRFPFSY